MKKSAVEGKVERERFGQKLQQSVTAQRWFGHQRRDRMKRRSNQSRWQDVIRVLALLPSNGQQGLTLLPNPAETRPTCTRSGAPGIWWLAHLTHGGSVDDAPRKIGTLVTKTSEFKIAQMFDI